MARFHEDYDLLLTPTVADVAPKHGQFDLPADLLDRLKHTQNYSMEEQRGPDLANVRGQPSPNTLYARGQYLWSASHFSANLCAG